MNMMQVNYGATGTSTAVDALGMRDMQARAYAKRRERYLLLKAPPASGKSRALMYLALDKLERQGLRKVIVAVPERTIGGSFAPVRLTENGFFADWTPDLRYNLCTPGADAGKVARFVEFMESEARILICTHATLRFAFEKLATEAFSGCLLGIDEFHHVSADRESSRLGALLHDVMRETDAHVLAMTGSYFRGDNVPILLPEDEARFSRVVYTYYDQLNGYRHLKSLGIGYHFYQGRYLDALPEVLDTDRKTILHIPHVNSGESTKEKYDEVGHILDIMGTVEGEDPENGLLYVRRRADGRVLKVADLVNDEAAHRNRLVAYLRKVKQKDELDIIIALGMAKEGFDWIWCEHALTIGYRSSLTEIVQIIGRATRDAEGKERARFTNLIAEPAADQSIVTEAVNDMLKAISASLLMEQVLAPRYEFTPKNQGPRDGYDYGPEGYQEGRSNVGVNEATGQYHIEINGLNQPTTPEASRICREDLNEVITSFLQDKTALERGLFDQENTLPEDLTVLRMGKIVRERYPELSTEEQEAIRQHAIAAMNITQQAKLALAQGDAHGGGNTALIDGVRKFVNVRDLDIDLIDRINPFEAAYAVLARTMDEKTLRQVQASIAGKKITLSEEEARELAMRALMFKKERGRLPDINSSDAWEQRMAEGVAALARYRAKAQREAAQ